jgi:hypothetical protein
VKSVVEILFVSLGTLVSNFVKKGIANPFSSLVTSLALRPFAVKLYFGQGRMLDIAFQPRIGANEEGGLG